MSVFRVLIIVDYNCDGKVDCKDLNVVNRCFVDMFEVLFFFVIIDIDRWCLKKILFEIGVEDF